ncbi:MAG: hypothetical protein EA425_16000 [Puniceicoccaceae bacterium]|nr:MAG: hypothetical protein EA425_16000 [Puniceicoccaceae bacterium]
MNLVVLPVLLPALTGLFALLILRPSPVRRTLVGISGGLQVALACTLVGLTYTQGPMKVELGDWPAPFGIVLYIDVLAAIMIAIGAVISWACMLYGFFELPTRVTHPLRLPLVQFLMMGINLALVTADLFNLFVAFEVMLLASYALITLEADDWNIKEAFPYLSVNLFSSMLFLAGAGFAYGMFGSLNFADIAQQAELMADDPRVGALGILLLVVFGIKAGIFPLYFWLPNSYPILPAPLAALYAGMLTKVGVYVILRLFGTLLPHEFSGLHLVVAWMGGLTMVLGVLGAVSRGFIRGILSFHILSQIGYMILAIGFFTPFSIAAVIFYNIHNNIVKASLFLVGGTATVLNRTDTLARMGNLWVATPALGIIFLCQALSLAGLPPFSGFWGKLMIVLEGLNLGSGPGGWQFFVLTGLALFTGILTLFSMLKIWLTTFWVRDESIEVHREDRRWKGMTAVVGGMCLLSLTIGFGAQFFIKLSFEASRQLLDKAAYIEFILGPS